MLIREYLCNKAALRSSQSVEICLWTEEGLDKHETLTNLVAPLQRYFGTYDICCGDTPRAREMSQDEPLEHRRLFMRWDGVFITIVSVKSLDAQQLKNFFKDLDI